MNTTTEILLALEPLRDARGMKHWEKTTASREMSAYGIGLTKLKAFAKQIKRNHELALQLWALPIFEARILATLVDDPKQVSREQVEAQLQMLDFWILAYNYSRSLLSKTSFCLACIEEWAAHPDDLRRQLAFLLLSDFSQQDKQQPEEWYEAYLHQIARDIQQEKNFVKDAMNVSLFAIGCRSESLHEQALAIARAIGKVEVDYGDNSCQAMDCVKHLTNPRVTEKFARAKAE